VEGNSLNVGYGAIILLTILLVIAIERMRRR
jgi:hypothetical protein